VGDLPAFGTVGEWQGSGRVVAGSWQCCGRGTAWEWHGMCELAFNAAGERHGMCESSLIRSMLVLFRFVTFSAVDDPSKIPTAAVTLFI
jgi:hypothetical protein